MNAFWTWLRGIFSGWIEFQRSDWTLTIEQVSILRTNLHEGKWSTIPGCLRNIIVVMFRKDEAIYVKLGLWAPVIVISLMDPSKTFTVFVRSLLSGPTGLALIVWAVNRALFHNNFWLRKFKTARYWGMTGYSGRLDGTAVLLNTTLRIINMSTTYIVARTVIEGVQPLLWDMIMNSVRMIPILVGLAVFIYVSIPAIQYGSSHWDNIAESRLFKSAVMLTFFAEVVSIWISLPEIHVDWDSLDRGGFSWGGFGVFTLIILSVIAAVVIAWKIFNTLEDVTDEELANIRVNMIKFWVFLPTAVMFSIYALTIVQLMQYRNQHKAEVVVAVVEMTPTATLTAAPSAQPSLTAVPATVTLTSTPTAVFTPTYTVTVAPSSTYTATATETPVPASGCNLTTEQLSGTPNTDKTTWVDNPYNGWAAYQTIVVITDSGEVCLISNSATYISEGEDPFNLDALMPIQGYTQCEGFVNGAGPYTWKTCYLFQVKKSKVLMPNLINYWLLTETAKVNGNPVYRVP